MMQKLLAAAGICLMALAGPAAAASTQTVITFDDVTWEVGANGYYQPIPDGYGGVAVWDALWPEPGEYSCCDNNGDPIINNAVFGVHVGMSFSAPISFVGADVHFTQLQGSRYSLFYKGNEVFSYTFSLENMPSDYDARGGIGWVSSGHSGPVDQIVFYGAHEGLYLDNVTYAAAPVPEPGSVAMVLAGLGLVGGLARRRQVKD